MLSSQKNIVILIVVVSAFLSIGHGFAQTMDAAAKFSPTNNPNGVWSYGVCGSGGSGNFTLYDDYTIPWPIKVGEAGALKMWQHSSLLSLGGLPNIFINTGSIAMNMAPGGGAVLDPGQLALHPYYGNQGDLASVVRWTAPADGQYRINAVFSGRYIGGTTTDVYVKVDGSVRWSGYVDGWSGGSYSFNTPNRFGNSPEQSYSDTLTLLSGQCVDFVVGAHGNHAGDVTGLSVTITTVSHTTVPITAIVKRVVPVRNPGFEIDENKDSVPDGWNVGEGSRMDGKVRHSGSFSLYNVHQSLQVPVAVKPHTGYRCSVWAKRDEDGLTRLWVGDANLLPIAYTDNGGCGMPAWSGPYDWQRFELAFRTGEHSQISIIVRGLGGTDKVWFDDLELIEDDTVRVGDITPRDSPIQHALTQAEKERGYLVFSRHPLSPPYHAAFPADEEMTNIVRCQVVPGEAQSALLMVRALRDLTALRISFSEPLHQLEQESVSSQKNVTGTSAEPTTSIQINVDIRMVRASLRQRSSVSYEKVPLFLPPATTEDLTADTTRAYWLTFHVSEQALPGKYVGTAILRAENAPQMTLQLEVHVRPIRLLPAPIAYGMYYDQSFLPEPYRTGEYQKLCYEDMKAHGMTSVTTYNHPFLIASEKGENLVFNKPDGKRLSVSCATSVDDEMAMILKAGLGNRGVPILYLGSWAGGPGSPEAIRQHQQAFGWPEILFYISDEPGSPERIESAKKELVAYQGIEGVRTVTAGLDIEQLGRLYDVWILNMTVCLDEKTLQRAKEWNRELWTYDCQLHGATPQHDRYLAGLYTWRWGLRGLFQWAYMHNAPTGMVTPQGEWKNTDYWQYGYVVAGPQGPIPTLGWEGRREGINDYRYLFTLETLVARMTNSDNEQTKATVEEARQFLEQVRSLVRADAYAQRPSGMEEYAVNFIPQPEITPQDYDSIREHAAMFINKLSSYDN